MKSAWKPIALMSASVAALSGTLLGVLTMPFVKGGVVNVVWGTVYGLGFWAVSAMISPEPGVKGTLYLLLGGILWPIVLTIILMVAFSSWLQSIQYRRFTATTIFLSFLFIFPMQKAPGTFIYYLPLFSAFLENL